MLLNHNNRKERYSLVLLKNTRTFKQIYIIWVIFKNVKRLHISFIQQLFSTIHKIVSPGKKKSLFGNIKPQHKIVFDLYGAFQPKPFYNFMIPYFSDEMKVCKQRQVWQCLLRGENEAAEKTYIVLK